MTSPVERISGPRSVSTPSKRRKGNTGALMEKPRTGGSSVRPMPGRVSPRQRRAARRANGTPVAFATNGTVREARGFTSRTKSSPPRVAKGKVSGARVSQKRKAELAADLEALGHVARDTPRRRLQVHVTQQLAEPLTVLGAVDRVRRGAEDRDAGGFERLRELQRRLTPELQIGPAS